MERRLSFVPFLLGVGLGAGGMWALMHARTWPCDRRTRQRASDAEVDRLDEMIAYHTRAIDLNPNDADAYQGRALAHWLKGDLDSTIADFTASIRRNPDDAWAYSCRGDAYCQKGDFDAAIQDCTEAIRLDPQNASAFYCRGSAYERQGDLTRANKDFARANEIQQSAG